VLEWPRVRFGSKPGGYTSPASRKEHPAVSDAIVTLSDSTFDESVLGSEIPVVIDFWAEWCGPCKMIAPVLEDIANEHKGKLSVAKLNVDDNPDIARRYEVLSIPTLLVFQEGELKKRLVGAKGKAQLLQDLSEFIA
jgi:thioredoxin 1